MVVAGCRSSMGKWAFWAVTLVERRGLRAIGPVCAAADPQTVGTTALSRGRIPGILYQISGAVVRGRLISWAGACRVWAGRQLRRVGRQRSQPGRTADG